ncbi:MAG: response regulator transcription factor [Rhodospirillales bacterium]|nr:MAG: response regulator transcription factor [Rhodospirillales bacterium]
MSTDKIRIAVVDDHPLFREGVATTLASYPDIEVVGEGASSDEALQLARDLLPDVLLLDVSMPGGGVNAARAIAAGYPVIRIVMLTVSEHEEDVLKSLKAGARGYILKGVTARELIGIVRAVHSGESYVTPTLAASLLADFRDEGSDASAEDGPLDELTVRERQILELLATGRSNKEIARSLELAEKTVKHYVTNILEKLQVRNRVEAAVLAQRVTQERTG